MSSFFISELFQSGLVTLHLRKTVFVLNFTTDNLCLNVYIYHGMPLVLKQMSL